MGGYDGVMPQVDAPRRVRADAARSTARILAAAEAVLAEDPGAALERIADDAGLTRATVHRRFASRAALLEALADQLDQRFLRAFREARVATADPWIALNRLAELTFELKIGNRFAAQVMSGPSDRVLASLDLLLDRLRAAGVITEADPSWCRRVCLALLDEAHRLPVGSSALDRPAGVLDEVPARSALFVRSLVGALGGSQTPTTRPLTTRSTDSPAG